MTDLSCEYMFGILDYQTFIVKRDNTHIGLITLNHTDRSADLRGIDGEDVLTEFPDHHGYKWWLKWVNDHIKETYAF